MATGHLLDMIWLKKLMMSPAFVCVLFGYIYLFIYLLCPPIMLSMLQLSYKHFSIL